MSQPASEGVASCVRLLAAGQLDRGWRVAIACPGHSHLSRAATRAGIEVLPWAAERQPGPWLAREIRELATAIARFRPTIVHLHSSKAGLAGRLAIRHRRPTVFQPHAWSFDAVAERVSPVAVWWERLAARWTDAIITVSTAERATAERHRIRSAGLHVTIPNAVDADRFRPPDGARRDEILLRRSLGLNDEPLVSCPGRLCHQKGQDVLLAAWRRVTAAHPNAQLLLVGDGPNRSVLEASAGDQVHFLGDRADLPEILRAVQLVVLPSRWEGMSLAMLEAMASARSVVTTAVGGVAETVELGAGAVVPVGDVAELAAAIVDRLTNPEIADREGLRGRRLVLERHRPEAVVDATSDLYGRLAGQPHSARPVSEPPPTSRRRVEPADV